MRALLDDQELDSRASTGAIYWEGLSLLEDGRGTRLGRGYLEMTGYAAGSCCDARGAAQCAPAASTATFFAGLASQTRTSSVTKRMPESRNRSSTASV